MIDNVCVNQFIYIYTRINSYNYILFLGFSSAAKTWLPIADGYEGLNLENQRNAVRSHYQVYRSLSNLRFRPAFRLGRFESLAINQEVFAFKRYNFDII